VRAVDLIRRKRDGGVLEPEEVAWLVEGYTSGAVGDEQMSAFCMAVFFQGMRPGEAGALVDAMLRSGDVLDLSDIPSRKVDKHSTGGVGDKVSICLAPLVAACGVPVPMISGRGLGHTGGTLDKLSAIPGFRTDLDADRFRELVRRCGLALIGQTEALAPADKRLYALRDVTATVESVPLIAASIMSKKLAEGIDALVLDVKVGSGAFMKTREDAERLARVLVDIGTRAEKPTVALLTTMDRVLGRAVGNADETWEAVEVLRGGGPLDLRELTLALGAEMLRLGGAAPDLDAGRASLEAAIRSGRGLERLSAVVEAQGGDPKCLEARERLPRAPDEDVVLFERSGFVAEVDVEAVGRAAMLLGAGRARADDAIDLGVGLEMCATVGDEVRAGDPVARLRHRGGRGLEAARATLRAAFRLAEAPPGPLELVLRRVDPRPTEGESPC
jgi:pyrimidine-nucleoside phosphorylase/thymidine phosphorylase